MERWLDPVYDAPGMGAADRWATAEGGVPSLDLMEAAGRALAEATAEAAAPGPVRVVCGKGNNGGDGLVAARHLVESGFTAEVLMLYSVDELSADSFANYRQLIGVEVFDRAEALSRLDRSGTIVDAVLGTGFEGDPRDPAAAAIRAINGSGATVVACDIPSGVNASTGAAELAVRADHTVTFHGLKTGQLVAPGKHLCGDVKVVEIGIPRGAPPGEAAGRINRQVLELPPRRGVASNKFTSGRVTVVGGSKGLTGAVCLAAEGSIRAGAGYATVAVPADLEHIFEVKLTEVMSLGCGGAKGHLGSDAKEEILEHCEGAGATVLGSGMGKRKYTAKLIRTLAGKIAGPLVIDADGLGGLDGDLERVRGRKNPTVLTPHPGEMGKLLGRKSAEVEANRLGCALDLASKTGAVVVLKGDDTIVTDGDRVAINDLPAPGLATAGTGDVLAGVVAAMLARGLEPFEAACAAVYAHTVAGRTAADRVGSTEGVIAFDVIEALPQAIRAAAPDE